MQKYNVTFLHTTKGAVYGVIRDGNGRLVWSDKPWRVHDGSAQAEAYAKLAELREAAKQEDTSKGNGPDDE